MTLAIAEVERAPENGRRCREVVSTLRGHEPGLSRYVGERRDEESRARGNRGAELSPDDRRRRHVNAVGAEIAVARFLNVYPYAFLGLAFADQCGDVGGYQVRNTQTNDLILRPPNNPLGYRPVVPDDIYVLVIGALPRYCIVGWIVARDGMRDEYWRVGGRGDCWRIPRSDMQSFPIGRYGAA